MTLRDTVEEHLRAIEARDLDALAATLAGEELVLVMADGKLVRSAREFLDAHRAWFAMPGWTLRARELELFEGADLGVALFELDYREPPATHSRSYLTLVFQKQQGRWRMVLDQNTPIK
jgi:ketosteroid isomerase-like protein